jgi:CheY-like chemotaxis protein
MSPDRRLRLLVVDDEPEICQTLATYFGNAGYTVDTVPTVPEALDKLPGEFDALISDIRLPGADGFALVQEARRRKPDLGLFLITGYPTLETIMEAKRQGVLAYFSKPLQLDQMEARLQAFLGEVRLLEGPVLVVGSALYDRLKDRLVRFTTLCCPDELLSFLQTVGVQRPVVVLADAAGPSTRPMLQAYRALGAQAHTFLVVSDPAGVEALQRLLFEDGVADCLPAEASRTEMERVILDAVGRHEAERAALRQRSAELATRCENARPYRNGYYCVQPDQCPYGGAFAGWISINGKEVQRCRFRPLVFEALEKVGFTEWTGEVDASRTPEMRKQLLAVLRDGVQDLVIDGQGLTGAHYNLIEILADVGAELRKAAPAGRIHVINLVDAVLEEFSKTPVLGVRFSGPRMIDEQATFARWGTRFE